MGCGSSKEQLRTEGGGAADPTPSGDAAALESPLVLTGGGRSAEREGQERSRKALRSLLVTKERDYLVDSSGKKVKVDSLRGLPVGLLFTTHEVAAAREFTRALADAHAALRAAGRPLEVVFLSNDATREAWQQSLREMPWLALPHEDPCIEALGASFGIRDIPTLVVLDQQGQVATRDGVDLVLRHSAAAWPFSAARLQALQQQQQQPLPDSQPPPPLPPKVHEGGGGGAATAAGPGFDQIHGLVQGQQPSKSQVYGIDEGSAPSNDGGGSGEGSAAAQSQYSARDAA